MHQGLQEFVRLFKSNQRNTSTIQSFERILNSDLFGVLAELIDFLTVARIPATPVDARWLGPIRSKPSGGASR